MTDADAFLEAIRANPDDDLLRLVYADWLEEHGQDDYARFIRLGDVIKKKMPMRPAERKAMREERYRLFKQLEQTWGQLAPGITASSVVSYHDGEPSTSSLRFDAQAFLDWADPWPFFLPRRRVTLTDYFGLEEQILSAPRLRLVADLGFMGHPGSMAHEPPHAPVSDPLLRALCVCEPWPELQEIGISDLCPSRTMLMEFGRSRLASSLSRFHFDWPEDPLYHHWIDVKATQPPAGAISEAIKRFIAEWGDQLPAG